jgi:hypothetical protein
MINIYTGTRQPLRAGTQVLLRVRDGNQKELVSQGCEGDSILVNRFP